jgi:stage IV sporulation protein FB
VGRSLDNPINLSFGAGRLFRVRIRIHVLFVLGAVVLLAQAFRDNPHGGIMGIADSVGAIGLLFLIVLIHEFGHCFGCRSTGGTADEILLWPLGGLAMVAPPHTPRAHLITTLAGPAVNVVFCILVAGILGVWTGSFGAAPWNPFHPFEPSFRGFDSWPVQKWLVFFFGLNYMLLLFNLAPVYPLDGGRVLQALLWPKMGYRRALMLASGVGMVGAIGFGVIGIFSGSYLLFAIAFFGYFTCWQQRQQLKMALYEDTGSFGYDFSQGYASLQASERRGEPRPSFFERRRAKKEAARRLREQQQLESERRQVDAILTKISRQGLESLTPRERRLLQKETERQGSSRRPGE